jgi:hypothetical protein
MEKKSKNDPFSCRAPWVGGTILCYGYTSALNILFDELFPLFGKAAEGTAGLGFGTQQIGLFQTARGIFFVSYMPTINPIIQHKAGLVQCYRAGSVLAIAVFFACPFIARLAPSGAAYVWTALIGAENTILGSQFMLNNDQFTKTGSGHTNMGKVEKTGRFLQDWRSRTSCALA